MKIFIIAPTNLNINSGSQVRARLIIQGLLQAGAEIAVASWGIPQEIQQLGVEGYIFRGDQACEETCREAAKAFSPDYIYSITEAFPDWAFEAAKINHSKVAFDLHAIGFLEVIELGKGFGPRLSRMRNSLNWLAQIRHANVITLVSPTLYDTARLFFTHPFIVPPFGMTDVEHFSPTGEISPLGKDPQKKQVLYMGNFYKWQGIQLLLDAVQIVLEKTDRYEFNIVGSIGQKEDIDILRKRFLYHPLVNFIDSIPYETAPKIMRAADILVIPRPLMLSTHFAIPQKIGDYMASGRLIIATNLASHRWALESHQCGILCHANPKAFAAAIMSVTDLKDTSILAANARIKAIESFDYRKQARNILNAFEI